MRFTPRITVVSMFSAAACLSALGCYRTAPDGRGGNGVTLTSGTLDSPPPPYQGMPGPVDPPAPEAKPEPRQVDRDNPGAGTSVQTWGSPGGTSYGAPAGGRDGGTADASHAGVIP